MPYISVSLAEKIFAATRRKDPIRAETVLFWQRFYLYVAPVRRAAKTAKAIAKKRDALPRSGPLPVSELSIGSHMRRMRRRGLPYPVTAWRVARGIRDLPDSPSLWCAGPLLLFAAGYFGLFGKLLVSVDNRVSQARRLQLARSARKAVIVDKSLAEKRQAANECTGSESQKKRLMREARDVNPLQTPERKIWVLTQAEAAAFERLLAKLVLKYPLNSEPGHLNGAYPPLRFTGDADRDDANLDVVICALAEEAQLPLAVRQKIVERTLTRAFP